MIVDNKKGLCNLDRYKCKTDKIDWLFNILDRNPNPYKLWQNDQKQIGTLKDIFEVPSPGCTFIDDFNSVKFSPNFVHYNTSTKSLMTSHAEVFGDE